MGVQGSAITSWSDMYKITGPITLTGPESIPNEAQNRSFMTSWWLNGDTDNLQGGTQIQDFIMSDTGSTASNNLPGADRTVSDPQVLEKVTAEWRLTEDYYVLNQIILSLNKHGGDAAARYMAYKREMAKIERRFATSLNNKLDNDLAAQPDATTQVGTGSTSINPTPLWTYVNEYGATAGTIFDSTDGSMPAGTGLPNGFTTIDGLSPSTSKFWRCWQINYSDSVSTSTVNPGASNFLTALTKAINLVNYQALPYRPGESTVNDALRNPEYCIPVSINGEAYVQRVAVGSQNFFRMDPQDPYYPAVRFAGIPFMRWAAMDTAAIYPTSGTTAPTLGAGVTEMSSSAAVSGPRFPLISKKWLRWFFHSDFNFYMWPTKYPAKQWDTEIHPVSIMHNRLCLSRRKMAMIYPSSNITI